MRGKCFYKGVSNQEWLGAFFSLGQEKFYIDKKIKKAIFFRQDYGNWRPTGGMDRAIILVGDIGINSVFKRFWEY